MCIKVYTCKSLQRQQWLLQQQQEGQEEEGEVEEGEGEGEQEC